MSLHASFSQVGRCDHVCGHQSAAFRRQRPVARSHPAASRRPLLICTAANGGSGDAALNTLGDTIKRKSAQLQARLKELGDEALEEQLQSAVEGSEQRSRMPDSDFRMTRLISDIRDKHGRPTVIVEVRRSDSVTTSQQLAAVAEAILAAGADAVVVPTDAEATPAPMGDLFAVCKAVQAPVLARDWFLHPIQIVDARDAGAAGALGIVHQVTADGSSVLSSFAAALGLEAPVEVVNKEESDNLEKLGVPFVAVNVGVGLSVSNALPSIAIQIADALVRDQPFGNLTLVGIRNFPEARRAQQAGADALFVRADFVDANAHADDGSGTQQVWSEDLGVDKAEFVLQELLDMLNETTF